MRTYSRKTTILRKVFHCVLQYKSGAKKRIYMTNRMKKTDEETIKACEVMARQHWISGCIYIGSGMIPALSQVL